MYHPHVYPKYHLQPIYSLELKKNYYTRLTASFPGRPGYAGTRKGKTSLDLNDARDDEALGWQWRQLDHVQTIYTSLHTDNHTKTQSLSFYRPDALPGTQPTTSKH